MKFRVRTIVNFAACVLILVLLTTFCLSFKTKIAYDFFNDKIELNTEDNDEISVMTYNIRCINNEVDKGERSWFNRAFLIAKLLNETKPSIICFQEVKEEQLRFLKNFLEGYECVYEFRDNTNLKECNPIFFRSSKYTLESSQTFWLSDTPERMSNSWGLTYHRICTMAVLKDKITERSFTVASTHLDMLSLETQARSINLINQKLQSKNLPALLMGDFNCVLNTQAIHKANETMADIGIGFEDENAITHNNFEFESKNHAKLDYIFETKDAFQIISYEVVSKTYNGVFPSDHFPIFAKVRLY